VAPQQSCEIPQLKGVVGEADSEKEEEEEEVAGGNV